MINFLIFKIHMDFWVPFQAKLLADLATDAPRGEAFEGSTNGGLMQ
jgi:hypothetical protein